MTVLSMYHTTLTLLLCILLSLTSCLPIIQNMTFETKLLPPLPKERRRMAYGTYDKFCF